MIQTPSLTSTAALLELIDHLVVYGNVCSVKAMPPIWTFSFDKTTRQHMSQTLSGLVIGCNACVITQVGRASSFTAHSTPACSCTHWKLICLGFVHRKPSTPQLQGSRRQFIALAKDTSDSLSRPVRIIPTGQPLSCHDKWRGTYQAHVEHAEYIHLQQLPGRT